VHLPRLRLIRSGAFDPLRTLIVHRSGRYVEVLPSATAGGARFSEPALVAHCDLAIVACAQMMRADPLDFRQQVRFAEPKTPFWIVARADDKTSLLSRDEERVLSAIPRQYATDATKIRRACGVSESKVHQILERLLVRRLIEVSDGPWEQRIYQITSTGLKHPQCVQSARRAQALRLPVESDRNSQCALVDFGFGRITDQRRDERVELAAPVNECPHAVPQATALGEKEQPRT
jgi:DNA-binding MarR family transcriptional regulator